MKTAAHLFLFLVSTHTGWTQVPETGLIAYFPLNGNARENSSEFLSGTNFGSVAAPNRFNVGSSALYLDGNSYVLFPNMPTLGTAGSAFSIAIWFKALGPGPIITDYQGTEFAGDDILAAHIAVDNNPASSPASNYLSAGSRNTPALSIDYTGYSGRVTIVDDRWHHAAYTMDGLNSCRFYVDGALVATLPYRASLNYSSRARWSIGNLTFKGEQQYFNGYVDDFRVYNRALSTTEVALLYAAESVAPPVIPPTAVAPTIVTQPMSQSATAGSSVSLSATVSGTPLPTFQWLKNGGAITGATGVSLNFNNVQISDSGSYTVIIFNSAGLVTSSVATLTINALPTVVVQPTNVNTISGQPVSFFVLATGTPTPSFQWKKDGIVIPGATSATLTISSAQPIDGGSYNVVVSNTAGSITSAAGVLAVSFARLVNLSVLTSLTTPGETFTLGYVVGGRGTSGTKPVVIRAAGPSLGAPPINFPGALDDSKFELFAGSLKTGENDNWGGTAALLNAMTAVGAFPFNRTDSKDAAAAVSVASGDNSVKVSAMGNSTGAVIAEIYDATPAADFGGTTPRLVNVSVLKSMGAGFTLGFTVGGNSTKNVLVRAIGPTLGTAPFNVPSVASDPQFTLYSSQTPIASNDNWGGGSDLTSAFSSVGAFALPSGSRDAAVVANLPPGGYSVQVSGVGGVTGTILVEVYELP